MGKLDGNTHVTSNDVVKLLPAGTILHIKGVPVELEADTYVRSHARNWAVIGALPENKPDES